MVMRRNVPESLLKLLCIQLQNVAIQPNRLPGDSQKLRTQRGSIASSVCRRRWSDLRKLRRAITSL